MFVNTISDLYLSNAFVCVCGGVYWPPSLPQNFPVYITQGIWGHSLTCCHWWSNSLHYGYLICLSPDLKRGGPATWRESIIRPKVCELLASASCKIGSFAGSPPMSVEYIKSLYRIVHRSTLPLGTGLLQWGRKLNHGSRSLLLLINLPSHQDYSHLKTCIPIWEDTHCLKPRKSFYPLLRSQYE